MTADPAAAATPARSRASMVALAVLLVAALGLQIGFGPDEGPPWRRLWFDALQQLMPRERDARPAVIVEIDEASLKQIGQWPWPRTEIASLVWLIHQAGARSIAVDILFPEPDQMSPDLFLRRTGITDPLVTQALQAVDDPDVVLTEAIRRTPTALAVAGVIAAGPAAPASAIGPRVIVDGPDPRAFQRFDHGVGPITALREAAQGLGAVSDLQSEDQILRRVAVVQRIGGHEHVLLAAEALRIADWADVARITPGALGLRLDLGGVTAPAEANGDFWLHVGRLDRSRYVSAADVLNGDAAALDAIRERIALVAVTGLGAIDLKLTPLREAVYGVEAHLQVIEQIVQQRFLRRPGLVFLTEITLTLALGLSAVLLIPRASPTVSLLTLVGAAITLMGVSVAAFRLGVLIDVASPALAGGLIAAVQLGLTMVKRDRARLLAELALTRARAASARIDAELDAAWEIQQGFLPPSHRLIEDAFELACRIRPARRVGGDFYDHFLIDDRRLFFMVGDVSGKGIEASVFMGLSKALWKSAALRADLPLERIQATANAEISRDNPGMMFVTGFAGILDIETGDLHFSSAGHEQPFIIGAGAPPCRTADVSGPPAGLDPDAEFPVSHMRLGRGQGVCVFSDGVSEAESPSKELYGLLRMERVLAALPPDAAATTVVDTLCHDVDRFVDTAPPSDDLTVMVVVWGRAGDATTSMRRVTSD